MIKLIATLYRLACQLAILLNFPLLSARCQYFAANVDTVLKELANTELPFAQFGSGSSPAENKIVLKSCKLIFRAFLLLAILRCSHRCRCCRCFFSFFRCCCCCCLSRGRGSWLKEKDNHKKEDAKKMGQMLPMPPPPGGWSNGGKEHHDSKGSMRFFTTGIESDPLRERGEIASQRLFSYLSST